MASVLQPWVQELTLMQQAVLLTAVRGPDGIHKNHVSKLLLRWFRRCILIASFEKRTFLTPDEPGGGSFTGALDVVKHGTIEDVFVRYVKTLDEIPHHFQLHLLHAAEILGYKHPASAIRTWWYSVYSRLVHDMHLCVESEANMDYRLGDAESQWRASEVVVAD